MSDGQSFPLDHPSVRRRFNSRPALFCDDCKQTQISINMEMLQALYEYPEAFPSGTFQRETTRGPPSLSKFKDNTEWPWRKSIQLLMQRFVKQMFSNPPSGSNVFITEKMFAKRKLRAEDDARFQAPSGGNIATLYTWLSDFARNMARAFKEPRSALKHPRLFTRSGFKVDPHKISSTRNLNACENVSPERLSIQSDAHPFDVSRRVVRNRKY